MWETYEEAVLYATEQMTDIKSFLQDFLDVPSPDDVFSAGTYVSGTAIAGYYAEDGTSYVDTEFSYVMGTAMPVGSVLYTAPWGTCVTTATPGTSGLTLNASNGSVTFNCPILRTNFDESVSLSAVQVGWNSNQKPLYNAQTRTTPYQGTGTWVGINKSVSSTNSASAVGTSFYAPLPSDDTTYNDFRFTMLNYINDNNGVLQDLTIDDIPTWSDEEPTEPTEPTEPATGSEGFTLDYDEILSEKELESILTQETYQLDAIDTGILTLESLPALPDVTYSQTGLDFVVDSVTLGKSLFEEWGLWSPLVATAVVLLLFGLFRGV